MDARVSVESSDSDAECEQVCIVARLVEHFCSLSLGLLPATHATWPLAPMAHVQDLCYGSLHRWRLRFTDARSCVLVTRSSRSKPRMPIPSPEPTPAHSLSDSGRPRVPQRLRHLNRRSGQREFERRLLLRLLRNRQGRCSRGAQRFRARFARGGQGVRMRGG